MFKYIISCVVVVLMLLVVAGCESSSAMRPAHDQGSPQDQRVRQFGMDF